MKKIAKIMTLSAFAFSSILAQGLMFPQFDTGPSTKPAWQEFKLNPNTRIKLNFKNASADMILELISKTSGITIVKDPALKDALTVVSAKSVSLNQAFEIVNTVLGLKGYEFTKSGDLLVVRTKQAPQPFQPRQNFGNANRGNQSVLKVYIIKYANAVEVAKVINDVFAPSGPQAPQNPFQFRGGGRFQPQPQPAVGDSTTPLPSVKASSDDFSNSVIVNATQKDQDQVKSLIDSIDKQADLPTTTVVYKLQYADAQTLSSVVQNVLTTNAPTGKGGSNNQGDNFQGRFQQALRTGSFQSGFGQVAVDTGSNSLVVSATEDNQKLVAKVIAQLDLPTKVEDTTFVFPLDNAKADTVAQLLQQAFGNRQGVSGAGFNANSNTARTIQSRSAGTTNSSTAARPGADNLNNNSPEQIAQTKALNTQLQLALQDPNATEGDLLTSVDVTQGGGFINRLFNGQNGGSQNGQNTTGKDSQGKIIGLRDLSGKATFIPDINTNSLIVVAPPEYVPLIRQILDQLDKIPQQVVIQTTIIEANLNATDQFGLEWKLAQQGVFGDPKKTGTGGANFGLQSATTPLQGFSYTLTGGDLSAFFNALKTDTKFDVLSTPRIFTSNNVQAQINISQLIPYITSTIVNPTGANTFNYSFENVGIVLTVTPRITSNGYVTMDIDQTANDLQGFTSFNAPIVNQREANTSVSVKDGNTVILGGIIRKTVTATTNKIPLLGDIPILGNLFKSTNKSNDKTELIVFLTPHIITNASDAHDLKEDTLKELSKRTQDSLKDVLKKDADKPTTKDTKP